MFSRKDPPSAENPVTGPSQLMYGSSEGRSFDVHMYAALLITMPSSVWKLSLPTTLTISEACVMGQTIATGLAPAPCQYSR